MNLCVSLVDLFKRISARWNDTPPEIRRVLLFVSVAGLLPWLTITSFDVRNYLVGAEQVLTGRSVYEPRLRSLTNGRLVPNYPYLPNFAMFLGVGIAPFFFLHQLGVLPNSVYESVARQIANAPGYISLVGIPVLTYVVCSELDNREKATVRSSDDWAFWGVLLVSLTPALWFQTVESGSDTFVALLSLTGIYAVMRDRWGLAGVLVGTATFKFTGLPFAAILTIYALGHGRKQFTAIVTGGLVSQIPNIVYFGTFFEDFLFVVEQRGTMSLYSGETRALVTAPLRITGFEYWYVSRGFIIVFFIFVVLGAAVALYRNNLVLGFAIGYLSTSYFAPVGELNSSVLIVLLLFEAAINLRRKEVRYLAGALLAVHLYIFLLQFQEIDYVSAVPFQWWIIVVQAIEEGTVGLVLIGLVYFSDHKYFRANVVSVHHKAG